MFFFFFFLIRVCLKPLKNNDKKVSLKTTLQKTASCTGCVEETLELPLVTELLNEQTSQSSDLLSVSLDHPQ